LSFSLSVSIELEPVFKILSHQAIKSQSISLVELKELRSDGIGEDSGLYRGLEGEEELRLTEIFRALDLSDLTGAVGLVGARDRAESFRIDSSKHFHDVFSLVIKKCNFCNFVDFVSRGYIYIISYIYYVNIT
jgi:hypothetical protein